MKLMRHSFTTALICGFSALMAGVSFTSMAYAAETAAAQKAPGTTLGVPSGRYGLDKTHGYLSFSYEHLGFSKPELGFNDFDVDLTLDAENPAASEFNVTVQADSIDSRVAEFDKHLKGSDYFDVANNKEITFKSSEVEMTSATTADVTGTLTIKGQSHPITLKVVLNKAGIHPLQRVPAIGVSAQGTLSRSQWGLSKYVPMVSDEVELRIEVELPRAKKDQAAEPAAEI